MSAAIQRSYRARVLGERLLGGEYGFPTRMMARGSWKETSGSPAPAMGLGNATGGSSGARAMRGRCATSNTKSASAAITSIVADTPASAGVRGTRRRSTAMRASKRWRKSGEGVIEEVACKA